MNVVVGAVYSSGINLFDEQELCVQSGNCFIHNLEIGPYLPRLPLILNVCPTENITCMNVTIDYLTVPALSRYK